MKNRGEIGEEKKSLSSKAITCTYSDFCDSKGKLFSWNNFESHIVYVTGEKCLVYIVFYV